MFDFLLDKLRGLQGADDAASGDQAPKVGPRPVPAGSPSKGADPSLGPPVPGALDHWGDAAHAPECKPQTAAEGLADATEKLADGPMTKKEDAVAALDTLTCLSPGEQSVAMKEMDPLTFRTLLQEVPKEDRVRFQSLMDNCNDPRRKLLLWQEFQKADAARDNGEAAAKIGDGEDAGARKAALENTLSQNDREVDSDVALLLAKGDKLSPLDVQRLMERKEAERRIELKYNVNLSHDEKEKDPAKRSEWNLADLERLDARLARVPRDQKLFEVAEFRHSDKAADPTADGITLTTNDLAARLPGALTTDVALSRAQMHLEPPDLHEGDAKKAIGALTTLPDAQRLEALEKLPAAELEKLAGSLPASDPQNQEQIQKLMSGLTGMRRLEVWKVFQKAKVDHVLDEKGEAAKANGDAVLEKTLDRAQAADAAELDEEVANLRSQGLSGPALEAKIDDVMRRKNEELRIEAEYGVNLTNDTAASIAGMHEAGDQGRQRRQWEQTDLAWIEEQLKKLPPKHRHAVKEFRRAETDFVEDPKNPGKWIKTSAFAQHHPESCGDDPDDHAGMVEVFDEGLKWPGSFVHEVGHNVEMNNKDVAKKYFEAAGTAPGGGAGTLPTQAEKSSYNAWPDEWQYGRQSAAEHFGEHYKMGARDPVRVYSDFVDRPKQRVAQLQKEVEDEKDPAKKKALEAELATAEKEKTSLELQWKIMREDVYGVDKAAVTEAEAKLPPGADVEAFREQAGRCITPDQLDKLTKLHSSTDPSVQEVTPGEIDAAAAGLPPDQREAFKHDAGMCFTPDQVVKLLTAYHGGKRAFDAKTQRGEWVTTGPNALSWQPGQEDPAMLAY
jgi:hypothetical protein